MWTRNSELFMRLMGRPVITQHDNEQETTCRQRNLQKAKYKLGHPTT